MFRAIYHSSQDSPWVFLLISVAMGGLASYISGKAIAETWRPLWQVVVYGLLLALVARFLHFALFDQVLLSLKNYVVDSAIAVTAGLLGYWVARQRQMAANYNWPKT